MANIGWSLVEIPYRSWSLEFSPEPNERTRIVSWIAFASILGGSLFYGVAPAGKALGLLDNAELNLQALGLTAVVVALLRSEEHTSELQSLMRISYADFCLKKKKKNSNMMNKIY